MFKKLLVAAVLMTSIQSFAGQDGNGGFGIQCGKKLYLLDLYEAVYRYNYTIDLGAPNVSVHDKVEIMLKRLERFVPQAAKYYRAEALNLLTTVESGRAFLNGKKFIQDNKVVLESDSIQPLDIGLSMICQGGTILPIARNHYFTANDQQIFIYEKRWKKLDNDSKAALILHELFYAKQKFINNQQDSALIRHLIALLSSRNVEQLNFGQFLAKTSFIFNELHQKENIISLSDHKINFYPSGMIESIEGGLKNKYMNVYGNMRFYEDGRLDSISFDQAWSEGKIEFPSGKNLGGIKSLKYLYINGVLQGYAMEGGYYGIRGKFKYVDFFNALITDGPGTFNQVDLSGMFRCIQVEWNLSPYNQNKQHKYYRIQILGEKNPRTFSADKKTRVKLNAQGRPIAIGCDPLQLD